MAWYFASSTQDFAEAEAQLGIPAAEVERIVRARQERHGGGLPQVVPHAAHFDQDPTDNAADAELLVIGSGPAGISAVRGYLEAGGSEPVVVLTADVDTPYMRPPLSKDVLAGNAPAEPEPIDEDALLDRVDLRTGVHVVSVDAATRTAHLADGTQVHAERIVLAPGSVPAQLPGVADGAPVHTLRSLADARRLTEAAGSARTSVVIGSGFIGCEAAASLATRGIDTTLVTPEPAPQQPRLGPEAAARIAGWLTDLGVTLRTEERVAAVAPDGTVTLSGGETLGAGLVLAAIGVQQQGSMLLGEDVQVEGGRVHADENLQVTDGIWVAGDAALAQHFVAGRRIPVEHWGDAMTMGEIAGHNAARLDEPRVWDSAPGFWSTIGEHTLKYSAWGDGWETAQLVDHGDGAFTVWYGDADGTLVGVLTSEADDDYERGGELLVQGASVKDAIGGAEPTGE